jgi:DnaJ-class molecular chaperone
MTPSNPSSNADARSGMNDTSGVGVPDGGQHGVELDQHISGEGQYSASPENAATAWNQRIAAGAPEVEMDCMKCGGSGTLIDYGGERRAEFPCDECDGPASGVLGTLTDQQENPHG